MTATAPATRNEFALTREQINFFKVFGFLKLPGLFAEEAAMLSDKFDELFERYKSELIDWKHEAHYMNLRQVLLHFIERDESLSALLDDPRIENAFSALLGEDFIYRASEGDLFTGSTYWHSDLYNGYFKYRHVKGIFYLEPLTAESGALRVIPGSHEFGDKYADLLERWGWKHEDNFGITAEEMPCHVCETQPGDLILFDFRMKHATCHSGNYRRMFTMTASQRFKPEDIDKLDKMVNDVVGITGKYYGDAMVNTASPARMKHLDQCLSLVKPKV